MSVSVPCTHCKGSGKRELTDLERTTLDAVSSEWHTTAEIADIIRKSMIGSVPIYLGRRAVLMRLTRLHDLGLIERKSHTEGHYAWRIKS